MRASWLLHSCFVKAEGKKTINIFLEIDATNAIVLLACDRGKTKDGEGTDTVTGEGLSPSRSWWLWLFDLQ